MSERIILNCSWAALVIRLSFLHSNRLTWAWVFHPGSCLQCRTPQACSVCSTACRCCCSAYRTSCAWPWDRVGCPPCRRSSSPELVGGGRGRTWNRFKRSYLIGWATFATSHLLPTLQRKVHDVNCDLEMTPSQCQWWLNVAQRDKCQNH